MFVSSVYNRFGRIFLIPFFFFFAGSEFIIVLYQILKCNDFLLQNAVGHSVFILVKCHCCFIRNPILGGDSKSQYNRIPTTAAVTFIYAVILICVYNATGVTVETNNDTGYCSQRWKS